MRVLLVYDGTTRPDRLARLRRHPGAAVTTLALTSDFALTERIEGVLQGAGCRSVERLDAAALVDRQVDRLRAGICEWSRAIGEAPVGGRRLREHLMLRGLPLSAWWLGLLSEKNTLKTDAFLRIAQALAADELMHGERFDELIVGVADTALCRSLEGIARRRAVPARRLGRGWRGPLAGSRRGAGSALLAALAILAWLRLAVFALRARIALGRAAPAPARLCFVSYFPAFDGAAAAQGRYLNRYTGPLQDLLGRRGIGVTWLLVWAPLQGARFGDSLKQVRHFRAAGASLFLAEEFWTLRAAAWALGEWLRIAWLSARLRPAGEDSALGAAPVGAACRPIVEELWRASFVGPDAMKAICFAALFRSAWPRLQGLAACAYICEMHAWEKALNASLAGTAVATVAFQHTAVSRNYFHYFHSPAETRRPAGADALPLPGVMAANGRLTRAALASSGYPGLAEVESLRYIGLGAVLREARQRAARPTLLVAGALDRRESLALARLVHQAFPAGATMHIVFKAHPYTPFESVFAELGVDPAACGYTLGEGGIGEQLGRAWAVVVPSSAVAIEALAYGCPVIVPVFADSMLMNPLAEHPQRCHKVGDPAQLRDAWSRIVAGGEDASDEAARGFVRDYWHLDPALPRWSELLDRLAAAPTRKEAAR